MGELNEIRTEELAFTEEEAECLLNEKMGLNIDPDDVSVLVEHTEGWPTGIYLAALSLQRTADKRGFIDRSAAPTATSSGFWGRGSGEPPGGREGVSARHLGTEGHDWATLRRGDGKGGFRQTCCASLTAPTCSWFLSTSRESGSATTSLRRIAALRAKSGRPDLVPTLRKRASTWLEVLATSRGRSGRPSWPPTTSLRDCLPRDIGTDTCWAGKQIR